MQHGIVAQAYLQPCSLGKELQLCFYNSVYEANWRLIDVGEPVDLMRISVDGADEAPARGCVVNSRVTTFLSALLFSFVL